MYYFLLRLPFYRLDVCRILYVVQSLKEKEWTSCWSILEFQTFLCNTSRLFLSNIWLLETFHKYKFNNLKNNLLFCQRMNNRPNWRRDLAWIKATWWKEKGIDGNLITFQMSLNCQVKEGCKNKCELVFNILVINVKAPAHHICTWHERRWQISQTCYLSSPQLALFFLCVCWAFLFCWEVTEGLIKKAGNSSILKKAPVQPWQSAHGFRPTRTWPAVSPHTHTCTPSAPPHHPTHTYQSYHH